MDWVKGNIKGVVFKTLESHTDDRGTLQELWRIDDLASAEHIPMMGYRSTLLPKAHRGPHEHEMQTDLFVFLAGSQVRLYLWDNRKKSKTYGNFTTRILGGMETKTALVPNGVVHGYRNLDACTTAVLNFPDQLYKGIGRGSEVDEKRYEEKKHPVFNMDG